MEQNNSKKSGMDLGNTQYFKVQPDQETGVKKILSVVYEALLEKGYDPVNQIVGYIMSGDPTYITNYMGARSLIMKVERDELVEEIMNDYIEFNHWKKKRKTLSRIEELCESFGVVLIVLGLPLNMDDSAGLRAEDTLKFREDVERRTGLPVVMSDERLTTVEAYEIMDKMEIRREDRGRYVDMIAASIILQEYMENHRGELEQMRSRE